MCWNFSRIKNSGFFSFRGQLKTPGTQIDYPIGVPIWLLQKNKYIKVIDNFIKGYQ